MRVPASSEGRSGPRSRGWLPCVVAGLVLASCASRDAEEALRLETQRATLENIAALERDTARFAASHEGIREAEVHIRANNAVVILSPAEETRVNEDVVARISAYITERTGLARDRIVIKARTAPMRGPTP